jgi:hypothetical protein
MATSKEVRDRHCWKKYEQAPEVECACGCGRKIKSVDRYGRPKSYVSGHNTRKYADRKQYVREYLKRNKVSLQAKKVKWIRSIKVEIIRAKGAVCAKCGYQYDGTNARAFDMHHEGTDKEFNLNTGNINKFRKEVVMKEAEKCILVCARCHRLLHGAEF